MCLYSSQKDEKNDRLKEPIRKRFIEYLDRAEMLKEFLNNQEKKQKEPVGANGTPKKYKTVFLVSFIASLITITIERMVLPLQITKQMKMILTSKR